MFLPLQFFFEEKPRHRDSSLADSVCRPCWMETNTLINHLHHGAATVTSKTGEEVMEKKRHIGPEIRFPTVFPVENANARCQK